MERFCESNEAHSTKLLTKKLKARYSDHLCFAEINSRKNVLCFKNMANCIINRNSMKKTNINLDDEAVAKVIREEIRNLNFH